MQLDPIWQSGDIWPDTADDNLDEQAVVQIYSPNMGIGYITTVPTHGRTDPFIDHFGEDISWAYMRDIEARLIAEANEATERMKKQRRMEKAARAAVITETVKAIAEHSQQLFLDFG